MNTIQSDPESPSLKAGLIKKKKEDYMETCGHAARRPFGVDMKSSSTSQQLTQIGVRSFVNYSLLILKLLLLVPIALVTSYVAFAITLGIMTSLTKLFMGISTREMQMLWDVHGLWLSLTCMLIYSGLAMLSLVKFFQVKLIPH